MSRERIFIGSAFCADGACPDRCARGENMNTKGYPYHRYVQYVCGAYLLVGYVTVGRQMEILLVILQATCFGHAF